MDEEPSTVVPEDENVVPQPESDKEEEDEDECRVCRGPADEGRPLFSPCKCSGSIGLTHQDCLTSWLAVTRGEGRCELCKVKFHFAPQYAPDAPDRLPLPEVFLGLGRRAVARWLPFLLRITFCISLWLLVAPLLTSYLYLLWMNRTISCVVERWKWSLFPADTVSGAVLAAIILISFLSLMSFADFLRVEWQQQQQQQPMPPGGRLDRRDETEAIDAGGQAEEDVDDGLLNMRNLDNNVRDGDAALAVRPDLPGEENYEANDGGNDSDNDGRVNIGDGNDVVNNFHNHIDEVAPNLPVNPAVVPAPIGRARPRRQQPPQPVRQRDDLPRERFEPNVNLDPLLQDDQVDMEINVALDELLGLRGPLSALIRNLLWLLVFNTVYLGFFAFIPRTIGAAVYSNIVNTTVFDNAIDLLPLVNANNTHMIALRRTILEINNESERLNTVFRLPDFATVNLGYLFCAVVVIVVRFAWIISQKLRMTKRQEASAREQPNGAEINVDVHQHRAAAQIEQAAMNVMHGMDDHPRLAAEGFDQPAGVSLGEAVGLVLDATVAVVKVGILLFLKMFLLPVLLGIWLDRSTIELFGSSAEDRILYAGYDLFSFILLHWVCGITFMLLVTVSVLQLREVMHPALLASLIRPQEPQPDLLGNLMHDSVLTQTKRMILSLGIYTALLHLHVSVAVKFLLKSGLTYYMPFLNLKFWHVVMPQLQVPLELLVFHLSMLALLEKYKNSIGELQHHWLIFMTRHMRLAQFLLPQRIDKFRLIGTIDVCQKGGNNVTVNPILYDLAHAKAGETEELVLSCVQRGPPTDATLYDVGETKDNGERMLTSSQAYISLPPRPHPDKLPANAEDGNKQELLPTKIGRFRLKRQSKAAAMAEQVIQVWEQVQGPPIPRPPEGWDDLGAGGADVQGRWAWGKERKSNIEGGVAERTRFFRQGQTRAESFALVVRVLLLMIFSWCATTLLLVFLLSAPLAIGRLLYWILRVPDKYIHSPISGAVGSCIVFPAIAMGTSSLMSSPHGDSSITRLIRRWTAGFRLPPARKLVVMIVAMVLWFFVCPLALGINYELCLVKSSQWFGSTEPLLDWEGIVLCWTVGSVLLNTWACLCSFSVFTKAFWVNVGNGMLDGPPNDDNLQGENRAAEEDDCWQGKHGRAARFYGIWKAVLTRWEWDVVDQVPLIEDSALPMSKTLGFMLLIPSVCYLLWFWWMEDVLALSQSSGQHRLFIFRLSAVSTLVIQLCISFREQIQHWFGAAHKTARDDRYLIGEILMNHSREVE